MSKRRRSKHNKYHDNTIINLEDYRKANIILIPRNINQDTYISYLEDLNTSIVLAHGPAGTGKTMLAVMQGIKEYRDGRVNKIVITRPAIGADDEKHGFLPGDINEKMLPWTRPIMDVFKEYYSPKTITDMIANEFIELAPLAYMRGRNFHNSFIICDEAQNLSLTQMKMILTRIGENSKLIITGDLDQTDRLKNNGLESFLNMLKNDKSKLIKSIKFDFTDIQRSEAVKEVLRLYNM